MGATPQLPSTAPRRAWTASGTSFIHDENNVTVAHFNAELLGRTRDERIDINGHDYGAELASVDEDGKWVDYVFLRPQTGEETQKHTWAVRHDGLLFASGWYEPAE